MGLFGKKKEQIDDVKPEKSEERVLKEALETEVENLQKEFRAKQEELEIITTKLQSVKEEYDIATTNLMSVKKESNQKKTELDMIYLEYKDIKAKLTSADEKLNKNKKTVEDVEIIETNITKREQELEKCIKEHNEIKEKITEDQSNLYEINAQQIKAQKELEEITARLYNAKQEATNLQQVGDTGVFTSKEKEFIGESSNKKETKGIIEAASVVVGSLKAKLSMAEKELETIQTLLEKERNEHAQTKHELERLKERTESN